MGVKIIRAKDLEDPQEHFGLYEKSKLGCILQMHDFGLDAESIYNILVEAQHIYASLLNFIPLLICEKVGDKKAIEMMNEYEKDAREEIEEFIKKAKDFVSNMQLERKDKTVN